MTKLTNQTGKASSKEAYVNVIGGAGSGTVLLMFAENIPDTYWFKPCLIYAAPSLSASFSALIDWGARQSRLIYNYFSLILKQSRVSRKINILKKDPSALQDDIRQLEEEFWAIRVKDVKRTMSTMNREEIN